MLEYSKLAREAGQEISVDLGFRSGEPAVAKDAAASSRIHRQKI
jgi:hypothetical protein